MKNVAYVLIVCILTIQCVGGKSHLANSQKDDLRTEIMNIRTMPYIPELSGDKEFWEIVKRKVYVIPALIELLDDTVATPAIVPNFGGKYSVGDIAYFIINEIIRNVPTHKIISGEHSSSDAGIYWIYVRKDFSNRLRFQRRLKNWYLGNRNNLVWVEDSMKYKTAPDWAYSSPHHPAGGYFRVSE